MQTIPDPMVSLGIDPGVTGAWAAVGIVPGSLDAKLLAAGKLPIVSENEKKLLQTDAFQKIVQEQDPDILITERSSPFPQNGALANYSTGAMFGSIRAVLILHGKPWESVMGHVWKRKMGLTFPKKYKPTEKEKKDASINMAKNRFGEDAKTNFFPRKGDHGVAEAALIAMYAIEKRLNP